ncbi:hypothetical protein RGUI_2583 [Rhodovulum sp. P5]|uniref:DUF6525 family protein n=1 Tax=Rhodovulum sp. P5 TaxID=1564506 RepID=UPI0009C1C043|nr:DUF6525 family protein [Rhodovulum sp. P5]ARE40724.1 hypothetical protein RGUI_2583 [Rhodovulum sp. P5]
MTGNARSTLPARARQNPMAAHDRLPPPARAWVSQAVLPWSAASVHRIWRRAMIETGSEAVALARLAAAENARLAKDRLDTGLRRDRADSRFPRHTHTAISGEAGGG